MKNLTIAILVTLLSIPVMSAAQTEETSSDSGSAYERPRNLNAQGTDAGEATFESATSTEPGNSYERPRSLSAHGTESEGASFESKSDSEPGSSYERPRALSAQSPMDN